MSECKTIAICNQKGGVGKTTTAVNLGAGLVRAGRRVLLVDCDPQGDLTQSLGYQADELDQSLGRLMYLATQERKPIVRDTILHHEEGMDLLPSNLDLSSMESQLVNAMSREKLLSLLLRDIKKDYDYILLDCSPSLGMITINALTAADSVIIPVQTQYLPAKGMTQLLRSINMVRTHTNEHLKIGGTLIKVVQKRMEDNSEQGFTSMGTQRERVESQIEHFDSIDLEGKNIVLERFNMGVYSSYIIEKGGLIKEKVNGKTDYLVVDPNDSSSMIGSLGRDALTQIEKGKPLKIITIDNLKAILQIR